MKPLRFLQHWLIIGATLAWATAGRASQCSFEGFWPDPDWAIVKPQDMGFHPEKLKRWVSYVFRKSPRARTDAVIVVHKGRIVFEKYARGYTRESRHNVWSVTKSFSSALIGRAEMEGLLHRDEPAAKYLPLLDQSEKRKVLIRDLLQMSSGLDFNEGYVNPFQSDVITMLYGGAATDMSSFTAAKPLAFSPGQRFNYSSGETNVLMAVLKSALPDLYYENFPWKELFAPLGINSAVFERDQSKTFVGSSYLYMTARDLARFGYLYLRDGCWKQQRLLPEDWVSWSRQVAPAFLKTKLDKFNNHRSYGAGWWLNLDLPAKGTARPFPAAPEDTFVALGHEGQSLYVIPSLDLVVVRLADDNLGGLIGNTYLKLLIDAFPSKVPFTSASHEAAPDRPGRLAPAMAPQLPIQLIHRLTAKEFCSCRFVEKQTRNFCVDKVRQYVPNFRIDVDEINRNVSAGVLYPASAKWISDRLGCQLEGKGP